MGAFSVHYKLEQYRNSLIFKPSSSIFTYSTDSEIFQDAFHMTFFGVDEYNSEFFSAMLKICNDYEYSSFALMGGKISDDIFDSIEKQAVCLLSSPIIAFFVSPQIALHHKLSEKILVGCISTENDVVFSSGFNANTVRENEFRAVVMNSELLTKEIERMKLDALETIIWLDNWFQRNIQYIKDNRSYCNGSIFVCPEITRQARVSDVFLNHYGTCEDISISIAVILHSLGIPCEVVSGECHAWLLVKLDDSFYIWDCTRNITRNECRMQQALMAEKYSSKYTLIGMSSFPNKYLDFSMLLKTADQDYPRELIKKKVDILEKEYNCNFSYDSNPVYESYILS